MRIYITYSIWLTLLVLCTFTLWEFHMWVIVSRIFMKISINKHAYRPIYSPWKIPMYLCHQSHCPKCHKSTSLINVFFNFYLDVLLCLLLMVTIGQNPYKTFQGIKHCTSIHSSFKLAKPYFNPYSLVTLLCDLDLLSWS